MSQPHITLTPFDLQKGHLPPNSNSRGDYITTMCTTQHPVITLPSGYTYTEPFAGATLVGPITWSTHDVLTFAEVANDFAKTSSNAPHSWDFEGLLNSKNKTVVESALRYGRDPACTSDFWSYAAANPSFTETAKSAGTVTLPNGQTTVEVLYTTITANWTGITPCCGTCSIYFTNLQMLYWPALHPNTACLGPMSAGLNSTSTSAETALRTQPVRVTDSDGYV